MQNDIRYSPRSDRGHARLKAERRDEWARIKGAAMAISLLAASLTTLPAIIAAHTA